MDQFSKITLVAFSCVALALTKPLPSLAFTPSDLDDSNDTLASLAVPLKMLRLGLYSTHRDSVGDSSASFSEAPVLPLATTSNLYAVTSTNAISRYDSTSGTLLQTTSVNGGPRSIAIGGSNQDIFVSSVAITTGTTIDRYDRSGNFLGVFTSDQGGVLLNPGALKFGPSNGNLFVSNAGDSSVAGFISQFDKDTGNFLGVFASNGSSFRPSGITFGVDANLYVSDNTSKSILRFNGATGALIGTFASDSSLLNPGDLAFGPNGNLFVGNATGNLTGNILQFNGTTGSFIGIFNSGASLGSPTGFAFGPDNNLYVADALNSKIVEFDGTTGVFIKNFASNSSSNDLLAPVGLVFGPAPAPEPAVGVGLPSLLFIGAYFRAKKRRVTEKAAR